MKIRFLFILCVFYQLVLVSQTTISGKIISENNEPLEGASVYFNNTTIGTISDENGNFSITTKEGNYTLVVSYLGFETLQKPINISSKNVTYSITLREENNTLDEVVVTKTIYDDTWRYNLKRFKRGFLGRTKLAATCKILNEKDIHFEYDGKTNTLTAFARNPLQIKHNGLGYLISYDLVDFTLQKNRLYFSGYARYQNLRKSLKKKWIKNREIAYNGSQMHFFRSLINNKFEEDGFKINQFERVKNPDRPTEEQIKMARQLVQLNNHKVNFSKRITVPKTPLDSALVTLRKSSLSKYQDYLYKRDVPLNQIISFKNNKPFLIFNNYLMVIYTKEKEESNYLMGSFGKVKKATGVQTSNIVLLNGESELDNSGITVNPNALFNEGYWGFEMFANMLPLDYQPPKD